MRRPLLPQAFSRSSAAVPFGRPAADKINAWRRKGTAVVVIANGKGGSGKSTLALNLSIGFCRRKKRVLLIDADTEQRTVGKWPRPAGLSGPTIVVWQTAAIVTNLAEVIENYDIVLIDFAGRDDRAAAAVLALADILISPAKPSHQDLSELGRFIQVARATNLPHLVVFNESTREMTSEMARLMSQFSQFKPYLPTAIQQLSGYRRAYAFGRGVLEFHGDHPAKANFVRVFRQLDAAINQARAKRGMARI